MPTNQFNQQRVFTRESESANAAEIHITGDMLPSALFLRILEMMKVFYEKQPIVFVVYNAKMMLLVKESIPSTFYEHIELRDPKALAGEEGLRRAG